MDETTSGLVNNYTKPHPKDGLSASNDHNYKINITSKMYNSID